MFSRLSKLQYDKYYFDILKKDQIGSTKNRRVCSMKRYMDVNESIEVCKDR